MTHVQLFRFSGFTVMLGAAFSILLTLFSSIVYSSNDPTAYTKDPAWTVINLLQVVAVLLVIVGLPGIYASRADRAGKTGLIAFVSVGITGLMFPFFLGLASVTIFSWLADTAPSLLSGNNSGPPSFFLYFVIGTIIQVVGTALLAILFFGGRLLPRWVGYVLAASMILAVLGFFLTGPDAPSNAVINVITSLSPVLLLAALGYMGHQTWSESAARSPATHSPGPAQSQGPVTA